MPDEIEVVLEVCGRAIGTSESPGVSGAGEQGKGNRSTGGSWAPGVLPTGEITQVRERRETFRICAQNAMGWAGGELGPCTHWSPPPALGRPLSLESSPATSSPTPTLMLVKWRPSEMVTRLSPMCLGDPGGEHPARSVQPAEPPRPLMTKLPYDHAHRRLCPNWPSAP